MAATATAVALLSACGILYVVAATLLGWITIRGWASVMVLELIIVAVLFLGFGILGGYLWNNLEQTRKRPLFIVDKRLGGGPDQIAALRRSPPRAAARRRWPSSRFPGKS